MTKKLACLFAAVVGLAPTVFGAAESTKAGSAAVTESRVGTWLERQFGQASLRMTNNFLGNGAVLASPSKTSPDYYYHWTRDSALTMDTVARLYDLSRSPADKERFAEAMRSYAAFLHRLSDRATLSGPVDATFSNLGEPKYYVDGTPFDQPWGRPQTDGPALSALTLLRFLELQDDKSQSLGLTEDELRSIKETLSQSLEYTAHHWQTHGFDLWEEVKGLHFYNALAQRRALLKGATWIQKQGHAARAAHYRAQAQALSTKIAQFWNEKQDTSLRPTNAVAD